MAVRSTSQAPLALPAVIDLGRRIAALSFEYVRQSEVDLHAADDGPAHRAAHEAMEIIDEQSRVLRNLVTTIPARSLADAAVQIGEAFKIADGLEALVQPAIEVERQVAALVRLLLSVLPLVAEAAGLDPAAMDWEQEVGSLRAARFAGLEGVA